MFVRTLTALIAAASMTAVPLPLRAAGLAVEVTNGSEPVLCAEKDNVTLNFTSREVKTFKIEAAHPAYIGGISRDSFEADWTNCDMTGDPAFRPSNAPNVPVRKTIYEEIELWAVALTFPTFWRPATATVRVGDVVHRDVHLLQIWTIRPMGGEEVLVLYPQDGYWRIRPKTPAGMATTAFGSSFMVGPVEFDGRPIVKVKEVAFDPAARAFTLAFERGGSAVLKMATVDQNRHVLDVAFDTPVSVGPFAAMRSMFITDFNNDVQRVAVRERGGKGWREDGIMTFGRAVATDVWAGRTAMSRHNTSSPDMVFSMFGDGRK